MCNAMKSKRLENLYRQPLLPSEESKKELPLEHILAKEMVYYPSEPSDWRFDIVEIGPGNGDFLFHLAKEHPGKKILGIELGQKRFNKISKRLEKRGITNVTLIHGDARIAFYNKIPDSSIAKCYVLFPDPWPKNRHCHRRLLQKDFCELISKKISSKGRFTLATDVKDYATWAFDNFSKINSLNPCPGSEDLKTPPKDIIPTYFQKKWKEWGRDFRYVRFEKKD